MAATTRQQQSQQSSDRKAWSSSPAVAGTSVTPTSAAGSSTTGAASVKRPYAFTHSDVGREVYESTQSPERVSMHGGRRVVDDILKDLTVCSNVLLNYGLAPHELHLFAERKRELLREAWAAIKAQIKRDVQLLWLDNKFEAIARPKERSYKEIIKHLKVIKEWISTVVKSQTQLRHLARQGINQVHEALNSFMDALMMTADTCATVSELTQVQWIDSEVVNEWRQSVNRFRSHNRSMEHVVAIFGLEKACKTTSLCAWFEDDILPMGSTRCTMTRNSLHYTAEPISWLKAHIRNADSYAAKLQDDQIDVEEVRREQIDRKEIDEKDANNNPTQITLDQARAYIIQRCSPLVAHHGEVREEREVDEAKAAQKRYEYTTSYALSKILYKVETYTNHKSPTGVPIIFCDLAGTDSGNREHMQESLNEISQCDALIMCHDGRRPNLVEHEVLMIDAVRRYNPQALAEAFVFVTRLDNLPTAKYDELKELNIRSLTAAGFKEANIFFVCPLYHLIKSQLAARRKVVSPVNREIVAHMERSTENPEVLQSYPKAQAAIEAYMKTSLQMKRVNDAIDLASWLKGQVELFFHLLPQAVMNPSVDDVKESDESKADEKRRQEVELNAQFDALFEDHWRRHMEHVNLKHDLYMNENRANRLNEFRAMYRSIVKVALQKSVDQFKTINPSLLMAVQESYLGHHDTAVTESRLRGEEVTKQKSLMASVKDVMGRMIYQNAQDFASTLMEPYLALGPALTKLFHPSKIVPLDHCTTLVDTLVTRFGYPLVYSVLRWPHASAERCETLKHLIEVSPTVIRYIPRKDQKLIEVTGSQLPGKLPVVEGPASVQPMNTIITVNHNTNIDHDGHAMTNNVNGMVNGNGHFSRDEVNNGDNDNMNETKDNSEEGSGQFGIPTSTSHHQRSSEAKHGDIDRANQTASAFYTTNGSNSAPSNTTIHVNGNDSGTAGASASTGHGTVHDNKAATTDNVPAAVPVPIPAKVAPPVAATPSTPAAKKGGKPAKVIITTPSPAKVAT